MPKRPDTMTELATIGMFAPIVIAARLQMLALETMRPTAKGRRETMRMTAEKPVAVMEGAFAMQRSMFDSSMRFWRDMGAAVTTLAVTAPTASVATAIHPARRRVRANARRLRKM